jgi:hypothetical protein
MSKTVELYFHSRDCICRVDEVSTCVSEVLLVDGW